MDTRVFLANSMFTKSNPQVDYVQWHRMSRLQGQIARLCAI